MSKLVIVSALLVPALAHADTSYVEGGALTGFDDGMIALGGSIEGGRQLTPVVWLHALGATGAVDQVFSVGEGTFQQARVGLETRSCRFDGRACVFVGVDVGYQHTHWTGNALELWDPELADNMSTTDAHSGVAIGRLGLDVGGTHVRFRPALELGRSTDNQDTANLTLGVAYRF